VSARGGGSVDIADIPDAWREAYYRLMANGDPDLAARLAAEYDERRRLGQQQTLQRCLDAIVWEWDNPYLDPSDWVPLRE
jgi:hypothetical protein